MQRKDCCQGDIRRVNWRRGDSYMASKNVVTGFGKVSHHVTSISEKSG